MVEVKKRIAARNAKAFKKHIGKTEHTLKKSMTLPDWVEESDIPPPSPFLFMDKGEQP